MQHPHPQVDSPVTRRFLWLAAAVACAAPVHAQLSSTTNARSAHAPIVAQPGTGSLGACPSQVLYVSTNTGTIYRIDDYATTPSAVLVTDTGVPGMTDIAVDPLTGKMYGISWLGVPSGQVFLQIDLTSGGTTQLGTLPEFTNALDFSATGELYGRSTSGETWEIDTLTGGATSIATGGAIPAGDLAWEAAGTMLVTTFDGDIERLDPVAGTHTILLNTGLGSSAFGIEVDCDGTVYVASESGDWMTVDLNTGMITPIGSFGISESVFGVAFTEGPGSPTLGTNYCGPGVVNSTGQSGVMSASGSAVAASNSVELFGTSLPTQSFGFFLTSQAQGFVANPGGSQGNLCLGGSIGRYVGAGQIQNSGAIGEISLVLDLTATPTPTGLVTVQSGETWNFQAWHRDAVGGSATSNFTDALSIVFQ